MVIFKWRVIHRCHWEEIGRRQRRARLLLCPQASDTFALLFVANSSCEPLAEEPSFQGDDVETDTHYSISLAEAQSSWDWSCLSMLHIWELYIRNLICVFLPQGLCPGCFLFRYAFFHSPQAAAHMTLPEVINSFSTLPCVLSSCFLFAQKFLLTC